MRVPLFLRNLPVYARAILIPGFLSQLYRWVRVKRTQDGLPWREIIRFAYVGMKGERAIIHNGKLLLTSVLPPIPSRAFKNVIQNQLEYAFSETKACLRTAPISIFVSVTARCPCRCPHCSRAGRDTPEGELSTAELTAALQQLCDLHVGNIGFTGGEPLLRKDLPELIAALQGRAGSILFTTGISLTREKLQTLRDCGLMSLAISFDFLDPAEHNAFRGRDDAYTSATQAMQWGKELGLHVIAMSVISRKYLSEAYVFQLAKKAQSFGANEIRLLEPVRSGSYLDKEESLFYTPEDREHLVRIYHRGNQTLGMPKFTTYLYIEGKTKYGCGAGILHSYLGETGELYPCDFIPASFGNIREAPLGELWKTMRATFGLPKETCIAKSLNEEIYRASKGNLPLRPPTSCALCQKFSAESKSHRLNHRS